MKDDHRYTYRDAGFNRFFQRSIASDPQTDVLSSRNNGNRKKEMAFDREQTSGQLGDSIQVGNIKIDGKAGRISVYDENRNEVVRIGKLD